MILPIGHEQTTVRRLPWITVLIMAACFLFYIYSFHIAGPRGDQLDQRFQSVLEYYLSRPYLEPDPRLTSLLAGILPPEQMEALSNAKPEDYARRQPIDPKKLAAMQEELSRLTDSFLSLLDESPIWRLGLIPARFSFTSLITYMFMHAGLLHLVGNLFFLYLCGPFIEDRWGRPLFTGFYLAAGMFSALVYAAHYKDLQVPLVGASGAVAGCLGAFLVLFWHVKIRFFYWIGWFWRGTFSAPAWLALIFWFLRELGSAGVMDNLSPGQAGGVAYWAHVWGFVFGVAMALGMRAARIEQRFIHPNIESKTTVVDNSIIEKALEVQEKGHADRAWKMLYAEARRDPGNADVALACWSLAVQAGDAASVVPVMTRVIRSELRQGQTDMALAHWKELRECAPESPVDPLVAVKVFEALTSLQRIGDAGDVLRGALEQVQPATPPGALAVIARLAIRTDVRLPSKAAKAILDHPEVPGDIKEAVRQKTVRTGGHADVSAPSVSRPRAALRIPPPVVARSAVERKPVQESTNGSAGRGSRPVRTGTPR